MRIIDKYKKIGRDSLYNFFDKFLLKENSVEIDVLPE